MRKPSLVLPSSLPADALRALRPIVQTLNDMTGARSGEIAKLPTTASLADVIDTLNLVIARINISGE